MRKTRALSIVGMASAVALILLFATVQNPLLGTAAPDQSCLPTMVSDVPAKDFPVREISKEAISARAAITGIDEGRDLITIYYADFSMCPFDENPHSMIMKGAIKQTIFKPGITLKDGADFQQQELDYYNSDPNTLAKVVPVEVNGHKGVGWEPFEGKSIVRVDGQVIEETPVPEPGVVRFYNEQDATVYFITANSPLERIVEIAESIQ